MVAHIHSEKPVMNRIRLFAFRSFGLSAANRRVELLQADPNLHTSPVMPVLTGRDVDAVMSAMKQDKRGNA
jgi:hypothetical protein